MAFGVYLAVLFLLAGGCTKPAEESGRVPADSVPAHESAPEADRTIDQSALDRVVLFQTEKEVDRRLMVLPAPAGFRGRVQGPRLGVRIAIPERTLHVGQALRLRLELQNVGARPVRYADMDSMMKSKAVIDRDWTFWAVGGDGKRHEVRKVPRLEGDQEAEKLDKAGVARWEADAAKGEMFRHLSVVLQPGESLVSFPRMPGRVAVSTPMAAERFVEVSEDFEFQIPGRYRISAEHRAALGEPGLSTFGPVESFVSPSIEVEVVR